MNTAFFIARKFYRQKEHGEQASRPALRIAIAGIAIGLAVMILSVCVVMGFKRSIREKVTGFGSNIEVMNAKAASSTENFAIDIPPSLVKHITDIKGVKNASRFSLKTGMFKTEEEFQTMLLKGVDEDYDLTFIRQNIVEGSIPKEGIAENDIVMSRSMAQNLGVKVGDKIYTYFFEESIKTRRFTIRALFETNMDRFDKSLVFGSILTVNKLNNLTSSECSGLDINLYDYEQTDVVAQAIRKEVNMMIAPDGSSYVVQTIEERYPQVFTWLDLLDLNVWVILALMTVVASFTMISGLLILILERTSSIGTLKALGSTNSMLRRVFLYFSVFLIGRGMVIGNVIALIIIAVQSRWHILKLPPQTYYIDHVPVGFNVWIWLSLNVGVLILTVLSLIIPSFLVSRIQPAKAIRFD